MANTQPDGAQLVQAVRASLPVPKALATTAVGGREAVLMRDVVSAWHAPPSLQALVARGAGEAELVRAIDGYASQKTTALKARLLERHGAAAPAHWGTAARDDNSDGHCTEGPGASPRGGIHEVQAVLRLRVLRRQPLRLRAHRGVEGPGALETRTLRFDASPPSDDACLTEGLLHRALRAPADCRGECRQRGPLVPHLRSCLHGEDLSVRGGAHDLRGLPSQARQDAQVPLVPWTPWQADPQ